MVTDFRDLRVWEEAMLLAEDVYRLTRVFPVEERFGLSAQLKRAAISVPSCIPEGNARRSTRDYLRFLAIAMGSLAEVQTQILLATRLGLADASDAGPSLSRHRRVTKLLQALISSLQAKAPPGAADYGSPFPVPGSRS